MRINIFIFYTLIFCFNQKTYGKVILFSFFPKTLIIFAASINIATKIIKNYIDIELNNKKNLIEKNIKKVLNCTKENFFEIFINKTSKGFFDDLEKTMNENTKKIYGNNLEVLAFEFFSNISTQGISNELKKKLMADFFSNKKDTIILDFLKQKREDRFQKAFI